MLNVTFAAQLPDSFFSGLFLSHAPAPLPALENALVGPLIAVLSFVCSVGNVPLAAVLWSGGISFAGVIAFLFADLDLAGLIPSGPRPSRSAIFGAIHVDYKLALNAIGLGLFAALIALTVRRGSTDPVCGMTVDRATAARREHGGQTIYFCPEHCAQVYADAHPGADAPADGDSAAASGGRPGERGSLPV